MNKDAFLRLDDKQLLALCIYGEARGELTAGKIAVGSVILERIRRNGWYGKGMHGVVLKPYQFSCFLENDPNYKKLLHIAEQWDEAMTQDIALNDCYGIASALVDGDILPNIKATHYKTSTCKASWADMMKLVDVIGHHEFYREA